MKTTVQRRSFDRSVRYQLERSVSHRLEACTDRLFDAVPWPNCDAEAVHSPAPSKSERTGSASESDDVDDRHSQYTEKHVNPTS